MFVYENARQPHNRNVGKTDTKFTAMPMHVYSESLGPQTASSRRVQGSLAVADRPHDNLQFYWQSQSRDWR